MTTPQPYWHHMQPRTKQALDLVAKGETWVSAATQTGVAQSTIARAIQKLQAPKCHCCGQTLKKSTKTSK